MISALTSEDDRRESVDDRLLVAAMYSSSLLKPEPAPCPIEVRGPVFDLHTHVLEDLLEPSDESIFLILTWDTGLDTVTADPVLSSWIQQLDSLCQEAAEENWDGEGAQSVQAGAREQAIAFVSALPAGTPLPECSIDPDGEISIAWYGPDNYVFSVSISGTGRLSYAGVFGDCDGYYGTARLAETIPAEITAHLDRLLSADVAGSQTD